MTQSGDIITKLNFFLDTGTPCHIVRHDGIFRNGVIKERPDDSCYRIADFIIGDDLVFVSDVNRVDMYRPRA